MAFKNAPKSIHGWKDGEAYCLSLLPRQNKGALNRYETSNEALREASRRKLPIVWEDAEAVT